MTPCFRIFRQDIENLLHELRCQAQRRFIEQQQPWLAHQRAADHQHHLLATGEAVAWKCAARAQDRELRLDRGDVLLDRRLVVAQIGADPQILGDREIGEDLPAFRTMGDAGGDDVFGTHRREIALRRALRRPKQDAPALRPQQAGDGGESRGLAGTIGADQSDDLALLDLQADAAQGMGAAAAHVHVFKPQHVRPFAAGRDRPR